MTSNLRAFSPRLLATLAVGITLFAAGPAMAGLSLSRGDTAQPAEVAVDVTDGSATTTATTATVASAPADQGSAKEVAKRRDEDAASAQYPQAKGRVARASNYTPAPRTISRPARQVAQFQAAPVRAAARFQAAPVRFAAQRNVPCH
jgi:hypothetical protein